MCNKQGRGTIKWLENCLYTEDHPDLPFLFTDAQGEAYGATTSPRSHTTNVEQKSTSCCKMTWLQLGKRSLANSECVYFFPNRVAWKGERRKAFTALQMFHVDFSFSKHVSILKLFLPEKGGKKERIENKIFCFHLTNLFRSNHLPPHPTKPLKYPLFTQLRNHTPTP